jgi:hypothetical protein
MKTTGAVGGRGEASDDREREREKERKMSFSKL